MEKKRETGSLLTELESSQNLLRGIGSAINLMIPSIADEQTAQAMEMISECVQNVCEKLENSMASAIRLRNSAA